MVNIESNGSKERMDERLARMHEIECRICDFNIDGVCKLDGQHIPKIGCAGGKAKTMTNADRLRAMNDEQLAVWIAETANCSDWCILEEQCKTKPDCSCCVNVWLDWLKEEVEESECDGNN